MQIKYRIRQNAFLARIAAFNLKKKRCAIVVHRTIYIWGITKTDFLADKRYVNHELQHVYQYYKNGTFWFLLFYIIESLQKGYFNNKFEVEARNAETKEPMAEFVLSDD